MTDHMITGNWGDDYPLTDECSRPKGDNTGCSAEYRMDGFGYAYCTREKGHNGLHHAAGSMDCLGAWGDEEVTE